MTILIIDDDAEGAEALTLLLANSGYGIVVAHDGHEGLRALRKMHSAIRLILLDMVMPGMDGPTFLLHLQRTEDARTPVIVLTASDVHVPHLPLLRKPVHPETLCATVALHGATWDVL